MGHRFLYQSHATGRSCTVFARSEDLSFFGSFTDDVLPTVCKNICIAALFAPRRSDSMLIRLRRGSPECYSLCASARRVGSPAVFKTSACDLYRKKLFAS